MKHAVAVTLSLLLVLSGIACVCAPVAVAAPLAETMTNGEHAHHMQHSADGQAQPKPCHQADCQGECGETKLLSDRNTATAKDLSVESQHAVIAPNSLNLTHLADIAHSSQDPPSDPFLLKTRTPVARQDIALK